MWHGHINAAGVGPIIASGDTVSSRLGPGPVRIVETPANNEIPVLTPRALPAVDRPRSPRIGDAPAMTASWWRTSDFMPGVKVAVDGRPRGVMYPTVRRLGVQPRVQILVPQQIWDTSIKG